MSPSYPNSYPPARDCNYIISQPNGTVVYITVIIMDIICQDLSPGSDYIEFRDGMSQDSPLIGRFCGNGKNIPASMQTTQNHLGIRWMKKRIWYLHNRIKIIDKNLIYTDSHQTTWKVALDSSLDMNQLMCPNGVTIVVHVEAISPPQVASWRPHRTQTTTQKVWTASTPLHSRQALQ